MIINFVKRKGFARNIPYILSDIFKGLNITALFFLIFANILLAVGLFGSLYPILVFSVVGIYIFLTFKKQHDILFISTCYQVYFLVTSVFIYFEFGGLIGYSDQHVYKHVTEYYFNSDFQFYDIAFNTIEFKYYQMNLFFTKIIYFLQHLSNGKTEILIFFNYSLYFLSLTLVYKNFRSFFSNDRQFKSFFLMLLFLPPSIFINSLMLKEGILMSLMVFLLVFIFKKKIIQSLLILLLIYYLRPLYIPIFFVIYLSLIIYYKRRYIQGLVFLMLCIFSYHNIDALNDMNSKFVNYLVLAKNNHVDLRNTNASVAKVVDFENLVSLQNAVALPVVGLLSPNPFRFLKSNDNRVYLESFFISIFWWLTLPFFVIFILKSGIQLKIAMLSIFLTVFLSSIFSILTIDGEIFRHRLPLYGVFMIGGLMGHYLYCQSQQYRFQVNFWFLSTFLLYLAVSFT